MWCEWYGLVIGLCDEWPCSAIETNVHDDCDLSIIAIHRRSHTPSTIASSSIEIESCSLKPQERMSMPRCSLRQLNTSHSHLELTADTAPAAQPLSSSRNRISCLQWYVFVLILFNASRSLTSYLQAQSGYVGNPTASPPAPGGNRGQH